MDHTSSQFIPLLIIVLLATIVPILLKRVKYIPLPIVVGEIIAGMIVGKSGFDIIVHSPWLDFLSNFGFAFLMFLSGLEVDFEEITTPTGMIKDVKWYSQPLPIAIIIFLSTLFLSATFATLLKYFGWISNIPLFTLILSTTSLGIVVPTLKERGLLYSSYGQTILLSALVADFTTMVLITVFVTFYVSGPSYKLLLILLLFVAFFFFYRIGIRLAHKKIIEELAHATAHIEIRGTFSLILIFIALAQQMGTEIILGAFLAGVIISLLKEKDSPLHGKLDAIGYGFFVPIFFVMVGANFDIRAVFGNPHAIYILPTLLVIVYLVKIIPSLILKLNYSWQEVWGAGFILSSRLSLIIAASAVALKLGAITESTNGAILLLAIITCTFSPILFNHIAPKTDDQPQDTVFLIGMTKSLLLLAKRLQKLQYKVVLVTDHKILYKNCLERDVPAFHGNIYDPHWLETTGISSAKNAVIATTMENRTKNLCRICKEIFNINHIVVLTGNFSNLDNNNLYGAIPVSPEFATLFMAENLITNPQGLSLFTSTQDNLEIIEVKLVNPQYFGKPLRKLRLPGDCLILSIIRNGEKIIPHGNNILQSGDDIIILGTNEFVKKAQLMMGNSRDG